MRWTSACVAALLLLAACSSTPTEAPIATPSAKPTLGATVGELIAALRDADPAIRLEAAERLATAGDESAVPALAEATLDAETDVALAATSALAAIGGDEAVDALAALTVAVPDELDDEAVSRYEAAITGLAAIGGESAVARLLELHAAQWDEDWFSNALSDAVQGLDEDDVAALIAALDHDDVEVRKEAISRLGDIGGTEAVDALVAQAGSDDRDVRFTAISALGGAGDLTATAVLVKALTDEDEEIVEVAADSLAEIHRADATPLLKYLKSKSTVKVYYPLIRIGQAGTESALVNALDKYGTKDMAVDYLNCGNSKLEKAARTWASRHGYAVITLPGGASVRWGS